MNTCKYIFSQITRPFYWITYCVALFFSMQHFGKLGVNPNDLVVKLLESQSRSPIFKTLGGSKIDSNFHTSEVDRMSTRNFWKLNVIKYNCLLKLALYVPSIKWDIKFYYYFIMFFSASCFFNPAAVFWAVVKGTGSMT